jgi:hypothetical protein
VGVLTVRVPAPRRAKALSALITINRLIDPLGYVAGLLLQDPSPSTRATLTPS